MLPTLTFLRGFPDGSMVKESAWQCKRCRSHGDTGSIPGSGRSPGVENDNTPIFLPGKFHGQRSLVSYSPRDHRESDTIEHTLIPNLLHYWSNTTWAILPQYWAKLTIPRVFISKNIITFLGKNTFIVIILKQCSKF